MSTHYINWLDAKEFMDTDAVGNLDPGKCQRLAEEVEGRFDNRLRKHLQVPIDPNDSPEAFAQAQKVCAMWCAAEYYRWKLSAQGTKENTWYADHLDRLAETVIEQLVSRLTQPEAAKPDNPLVYIPSMGDADKQPHALFKRKQIRVYPEGGERW